MARFVRIYIIGIMEDWSRSQSGCSCIGPSFEGRGFRCSSVFGGALDKIRPKAETDNKTDFDF